jgi:ribosomal protein S8
MKLDYIYVINHLKLNIARKTYFFDIRVTRQILLFLKVLYNLNVIRRFVHTSNTTCRVYISWFGKTNNSLNLKLYSRSSSPIRIKLNSLKILRTNTYNSHLILNTSKGILTHQDAIKFGVGGLIICIIS